jgi:hypothetical protein
VIEALFSSVVEFVFTMVWKFILWPVALALSTPVILIYAWFAKIRYRQRFIHAVADGYSSVSAFWEKWAF